MLQDPKYIPPLAAFNEKYIMIPMQNSGRNVIVFLQETESRTMLITVYKDFPFCRLIKHEINIWY